MNTVKLQQNGYLVDNSMSVPNDNSNRHYQEVQVWIAEGNTPEPEFSVDEIEIQRVKNIEIKATQVIEATYSPLKQRKLLSIAVALQDKVINGGVLTVDEEALVQANRDANTWITDIRTKENTAITDGTILEDIIW